MFFINFITSIFIISSGNNHILTMDNGFNPGSSPRNETNPLERTDIFQKEHHDYWLKLITTYVFSELYMAKDAKESIFDTLNRFLSTAEERLLKIITENKPENMTEIKRMAQHFFYKSNLMHYDSIKTLEESPFLRKAMVLFFFNYHLDRVIIDGGHRVDKKIPVVEEANKDFDILFGFPIDGKILEDINKKYSQRLESSDTSLLTEIEERIQDYYKPEPEVFSWLTPKPDEQLDTIEQFIEFLEKVYLEVLKYDFCDIRYGSFKKPINKKNESKTPVINYPTDYYLNDLPKKISSTLQTLKQYKASKELLENWKKIKNTDDPMAIVEALKELNDMNGRMKMTDPEKTLLKEKPFVDFFVQYKANVDKDYEPILLPNINILANLFKIDLKIYRTGNYNNWNPIEIVNIVNKINIPVVTNKFQTIKEALEANEAQYLAKKEKEDQEAKQDAERELQEDNNKDAKEKKDAPSVKNKNEDIQLKNTREDKDQERLENPNEMDKKLSQSVPKENTNNSPLKNIFIFGSLSTLPILPTSIYFYLKKQENKRQDANNQNGIIIDEV